MTRERITQLIQSTNPEDIELALQFLGSYKIKQIREIVPGGKWNLNSQSYAIELKVPFRYVATQYIRLSSCLFLTKYSSILLFTSKPLNYIKYKSLYE